MRVSGSWASLMGGYGGPKMTNGANVSYEDLRHERDHLENLVCQRFNFFLLFLSLIILGAVTTSKQLHFQVVLWFGAIISILLALTINRAGRKLDIILDRLFAGTANAIGWVNGQAGGHSVRHLVSAIIPALCCLALLAAAILAALHVLTVP